MLKFDVSTLCAVCYLRQQRARSGATRLPVLFVDEITSETRVVFENEEFGTFHLTFHIKLNITLDKHTYAAFRQFVFINTTRVVLILISNETMTYHYHNRFVLRALINASSKFDVEYVRNDHSIRA